MSAFFFYLPAVLLSGFMFPIANMPDVVQAFTDDALTTCDECNGRLRKIFGKVGVVFKGSGFYRTDSGSSSK